MENESLTTTTARLLFAARDAMAQHLADIDAQLNDARRKHYLSEGRGALPRMESFRRELGA